MFPTFEKKNITDAEVYSLSKYIIKRVKFKHQTNYIFVCHKTAILQGALISYTGSGHLNLVHYGSS